MDTLRTTHRRDHPLVAITWVLLLFAFGGLLHLCLDGFVFDPDDFPREHWRDRIGPQSWLLAVAAALPLTAVATAIAALVPFEWRAELRPALSTAIAIAVLLELAIFYIGLGNIEYSQRHAGFA